MMSLFVVDACPVCGAPVSTATFAGDGFLDCPCGESFTIQRPQAIDARISELLMDGLTVKEAAAVLRMPPAGIERRMAEGRILYPISETEGSEHE